LSCASRLLCRLSSQRPLVLSLCCPLVLSLSSDYTALSLSHLTSWLLHHLLLHRPLIVLSLCHSHCHAQASCVAPPSRCAVLLSSPCPLTVPPSHCLISPAGCCVASRHAAYLSSSYSFALLSSCAGWLLRCFSLHSPLVVSSSSTLNLSSLGSWTHLMQYSYGIAHQTVEKVERRRDKGGGRK
jgi:hypothetical protein